VPRENVLYVHLRDDGGIFTVRGTGEQGLESSGRVLTEVARIAAAGGLILYSRDHPDREPPDRVTRLFQLIADRRPAIKLVSKPHPDAVPKDGTSSLMVVAFLGDVEAVADLLDRGAAIEEQDSVGQTALMYGANAGKSEVVDRLLAAGADPNRRDREGNAPVMFAAQHGHADIVDALLRAGADPAVKGKAGLTALDLARQNGHTDLFDRLAVK
jgi:ankyrin repeat protein